MTVPHPLPFLCPTLIGRQQELTALQGLMERKRHGEGPVILISGEAGIGKSRLVAEAKTVATAQNFLLLEGHCFQGDNLFPYAPLLDLFRSYFARFAPTGRAPHLRSFVSTLSRLLPDVALLFPDLETLPALPAGSPEAEKRQLFAAMTHFLTEQAANQPVFLVVEDVHWSDDLSLDFLLRLARSSRNLPLLLLLTYRREALPAEGREWLTQLNRERLALEFPLGPLSRNEVGSMVRATLGLEQAVDAELLDTLSTLSEGNPFFVEELLKSLVIAGELQRVNDTWVRQAARRDAGRRAFIPRSVQEVVHQQADRVSAAAKQVLTLAAVAGRRFDFPVLQQALSCHEDHLLVLVKELLAAQLIVEESADQFAFRHALIREAIYSELLVRERQALHRALAQTLEQLSVAPVLRERYLGDLATHYSAAGMWEQAFFYEHQMGEHALILYAPRAALDHLTRALLAAQHLSVTPPGQVYYARGQAYGTLGDFDHAQSDYEHALDLAQTASDGPMEWQCLLALGVLWAERDYAQAGVWFRQALDLAERLAAPTLQARSLNRMGNWLVNTGRLEEGLRAHQDALRLFEEQHHEEGMAETLDLLGTAYGMRGERVKAVEALGQAIPLFQTLGDTPSLITSLAMRAIQAMPGSSETTLCPLRTRDACVHDAEDALRLARQIDSPAGQAFAENALAHTLLSFGEFGQALAHAHEARRIATEIGHQQWMVATSYALGHLYVLLLAPALAIPVLQAGEGLAQELGSAFWMATLAALQGRAYLLNQDLSAAQTALQAIMPREQHPRTVAERQVALVWGELALCQCEPGIALQIAERLLVSASGQRAGQPNQPIPHLLQLQGEARLSLGRLEEAVAALEEAKRGAMERGSRPLLWTIQRALGHAYHRLQRSHQARQAYAAARHLVEELAPTMTDASLGEQFLHAALGSLPPVPKLSPREAARHAFGGLTAREREVAALVAQGKTSREIADRLVISERTAEGHVNNMLGKLGFTSRAQIAAWVVERGLATRAPSGYLREHSSPEI
jgi:DNA-binding CsgD family transcriptional regulator/Flp pilus assembly protein TadD